MTVAKLCEMYFLPPGESCFCLTSVKYLVVSKMYAWCMKERIEAFFLGSCKCDEIYTFSYYYYFLISFKKTEFYCN